MEEVEMEEVEIEEVDLFLLLLLLRPPLAAMAAVTGITIGVKR